ncbi:protein phosphatase 2C domain-containing protein [Hyphococcus luteus]|uniref:PPM-type phosphatase domain-containing protein n=1 Tax=Hyphococcus luteus TaxID=2058213 RepID=A0A2S7K9Y8_9PROT|nr:protein phosphatase 2C domain-containing protein [Marinicaulis flavus]PQA89307.1 hypothetical protein CW354_00050 [Marinicaulis flavus]
MPFSLRALASDKGEGNVNEDQFGYLPHAAWVIDGASSVGAQKLPAKSDAKWYASHFSAILQDQLEQFPGAESKELLRNVIRILRKQYKAALAGSVPEFPPSAAFIMAREKEDLIEISALGDCAALYQAHEGPLVHMEGNETPIDGESLRKLKDAQKKQPEASHSEIRQLLASTLRENRARMNTPNGYWILSIEEEAVDHIRVANVKLDKNSPILLMSDGFTRGIFMLSNASVQSFYNTVIEDGAIEICKRIRRQEAADQDCRTFPRFKVHDDATCLMLTLEKTFS